MKNILLISFALVFVGGCDKSSNPVADDGSWQSGSLSTGGTFTHQFDTAGEFGYKCGIHSSMTGTIIVQ